MWPQRFIPFCVVLVLLTSLLLALVLPSPALAAEPAWLEIHSAHFTVITDAGEKRGREVALRFEQMRAVFANLLGKNRLSQPLPLTIMAFKNDKTYFQLAPLHNGEPIEAPGFFVPGEDQGFFVLNLFEPEPWRAVTHDFAHLLLNYNYPPAQGWFDEGLAEYFSSVRIDNKQVEIGGDPEVHSTNAQTLLPTPQLASTSKSLSQLLGAQVWLSIPDLFTMKHDTASFNEGTHHTLFYAESWIVMHYILHANKLAETGTYFNLALNQNIPVEEAIQQAYGMNAAQFEQAVKDYFHSLPTLDEAAQKLPGRTSTSDAASNPAQAYRFPVPVGPDDSVINSKAMAEADARAIYADVQTRVPERREAGLKELQNLATAPAATGKQSKASDADSSGANTSSIGSGNEIAHRAIAWDDIEHDKFDEALAELRDAAAINPQDTWIRFYLSVLKYRSAQAKRGEIQGLANMMQDLRAVIDWYPEFAGAYDLLAVARNAGGGPKAALDAERAAMQLSPRDELYAYHLAEIYVTARNWDAATVLLNRLKTNSDPQVSSQAKARLEEIGNERKYGVSESQNSSKLEAQKSPFDVLEQDAAQRAAAENAQSSSTADKRAMKFLKGRLIRVDCSQAPAATITVSEEGAVFKLHTSDYKSLLLIGADEFSCDWSDRNVSVNYKPSGAAEGDLVSLEVR